jgi:asparagine synthase (glutamine-hydrolysing)
LHAPELAQSEHGAKMEASNALFKGAILSEESVSHPDFDDLCGFTPAWIQPWILTLGRVRPLFTDTAQEALHDYDPIGAIAREIDPAQIRGRHVLDKVQYTWIKTMLECQILNWGGDRVDMANSMESRPPFLDHRLAAFAKTVPPSLRIHDGVEKWVLREAMKGILPEVLYKREKFAFMAPPANTDRKKGRAIREMVQTWMGREQVEQVGLFDADRVASFVEGYFEGSDPVVAKRNDIILNHLLGLHIIHQELVAPA